MGKIFGYVILLSNLSIILGVVIKDPTSVANHEKEKQENHTLPVRSYLAEDRNDILIKRYGESGWPSGYHGRRRPYPSKSPGRPPQMMKTPGLQAYATKDPVHKPRRYPPIHHWRNEYHDFRKKHPKDVHSTSLYPKDLLHPNQFPKDLVSSGSRTPRLPFNFNQSSINYKTKDDWEKENRRNHYGRSARLNHPKHSSKICDPCNSVPWVPLIKVPDSYRQHRTHFPETKFPEISNPTNHDFSLDIKDTHFASDTQNILLPPVPLVPPLEPIYDGTISSSFGLPIGNIPTGHGLLAPINPLATKINRYGANNLDFSNTLTFIPTQSILESSPFPELSPVPIVPIHDSTQFYQFDSSIADLVPPTKPVDVANVVLTISEGDNGKLDPNSVKIQTFLGKDQNSGSSSSGNKESYNQDEEFPPLHKPLPIPKQPAQKAHGSPSQSLPLSSPSSQSLHVHNSPAQSLQVPNSPAINLPVSNSHSQSLPLSNPSSQSLHVHDSSAQSLPVPHPPAINLPVSNSYSQSSHAHDSSAQSLPVPHPPAINFHVPNSPSQSLPTHNHHAQSLPNSNFPVQNHIPIHNQDSGKLEIVQSIPVAEFTSIIHQPASAEQLPSLSPPPPDQFTGSIYNPHPQPKFNPHKDVGSHIKNLNHTNLNFLKPPPVKNFKSDTSYNSSKNVVLPFLKPPKYADLQFQESVKSSTVPRPLTSASVSWLFSENTIQSTTSKTTQAIPQQFFAEAQEIASVVNHELRPVSPQPYSVSSPSTDTTKSKKIQIIIPYTTKNKNRPDNNALESVHHEVYQTIQPPVSKSTHEKNSLRDLATSGPPTLSTRDHLHLSETNRDRKVIDVTQTPMTFNVEHSRNDPESHKYLNDMHHIIASNIRELLKEEIEKAQTEQNYPLQNNIDNWTALEYSNHKTVGAKAPKEIINQALAVTSIPGTSISHLLLPSKKIPNEYFVTTSAPIYDEPEGPVYKPANSSVDSKPFTAKPYATTNHYHPTRSFRQSTLSNHERNYTEVTRGKANNWGKLNENLVLPEARPKLVETTTASTWTVGYYTPEKIQIVTPISSSTYSRNYTAQTFRRTTREVQTTEQPTTTVSNITMVNSTKLEKVNSTFVNRKLFLRYSNSTQRQNFLSRITPNRTDVVNKTESELIANQTLLSLFPMNITSEELMEMSMSMSSNGQSINDIFPFRNKELPWEMRSNVSETNFRNGRQRKSLIKQTKLLKPKPTMDSS